MVGPNDSSWLTVLMEWLRNTLGNAPSNTPPTSNFNQPPPIQPGSQNSAPLPPPSFPSTPSINPSSGTTPPTPPSPNLVDSMPTQPTSSPLPDASFNKLPTEPPLSPTFIKETSPLTAGVSNIADKIWDKLVPASVKDKLGQHLGNVSLGAMVGFVFQLFLSIYFYMTIAGIIVVYKLFKALDALGILGKFKNLLYSVMGSVFNISDQCFMKLGDLKAFWDCIKPL